MTDKHYLVYNYVCANQSMTKAAELLYMSQPSVSRYIQDLEKYYNTTLFKRSKNGLELTEEGKLLWTYSQNIVSNLNFLDDNFRNIGKKSLRFGIIPALAETICPEILENIKKIELQIGISIIVDTTEKLSHLMDAGEIDVILSDRSSNVPNMSEHQFFKSKLIVLASKASSIPDPITIPELAKYDLLLKERVSASRKAVETMFADAGILISPKYESSSNSFLMTQCEVNSGVLIISKALGNYYLKQYNLKTVEISDCKTDRSFYISYKKQLSSHKEFSKIFEMIQQMIKKYDP